MTIHPHLMHTVARERAADLLREAAAARMAAEARQTTQASQPAGAPQSHPSASRDLTPAGAQQR
jgi:hypothetical protein